MAKDMSDGVEVAKHGSRVTPGVSTVSVAEKGTRPSPDVKTKKWDSMGKGMFGDGEVMDWDFTLSGDKESAKTDPDVWNILISLGLFIFLASVAWNYSPIAFFYTFILIPPIIVVVLYAVIDRPLNHLLGDYAKLLSPKDPIHAMSLVLVYLTLGAILLLLAIGQPWFVYEVDYDYYGSSDLFTYHYDLNGISVDISEEDDQGFSSYPYSVYPNLTYEGSEHFEDAAAIASSTRYLVTASFLVWSIPGVICIFLIHGSVVGLTPRLRKLSKVEKMQAKIDTLSQRVNEMLAKGIVVSSLHDYIDRLRNLQTEKELPLPTPPSKLLTAFIGFISIAALVAISAVLYFEQNWPEAIDDEEFFVHTGGVISGSSSLSSTFVSGPNYEFIFKWGRGSAQGLIYAGNLLAFCGVVRNSLHINNFLRKGYQQLTDLWERTDAFTMPDFDGWPKISSATEHND